MLPANAHPFISAFGGGSPRPATRGGARCDSTGEGASPRPPPARPPPPASPSPRSHGGAPGGAGASPAAAPLQGASPRCVATSAALQQGGAPREAPLPVASQQALPCKGSPGCRAPTPVRAAPRGALAAELPIQAHALQSLAVQIAELTRALGAVQDELEACEAQNRAQARELAARHAEAEALRVDAEALRAEGASLRGSLAAAQAHCALLALENAFLREAPEREVLSPEGGAPSGLSVASPGPLAAASPGPSPARFAGRASPASRASSPPLSAPRPRLHSFALALGGVDDAPAPAVRAETESINLVAMICSMQPGSELSVWRLREAFLFLRGEPLPEALDPGLSPPPPYLAKHGLARHAAADGSWLLVSPAFVPQDPPFPLAPGERRAFFPVPYSASSLGAGLFRGTSGCALHGRFVTCPGIRLIENSLGFALLTVTDFEACRLAGGGRVGGAGAGFEDRLREFRRCVRRNVEAAFWDKCRAAERRGSSRPGWLLRPMP